MPNPYQRPLCMNNAMIQDYTARDVATVQREAAIVLRLTPDGVTELWRPNARLNVLAVIGPTSAFGLEFAEAVLCEVGLHESRPYHRAKKPRLARNTNEPRAIPQRRKWFQLTTEQYQLAGLAIFRQLQLLTNRRVATWKRGLDNPHYIKSSKSFFIKSQVKEFQARIYQQPACRFSSALADEQLVSDLYWAELNSPTTRNYLQGAARRIDVVLKRYRRDGYCRVPEQLIGFQRAEQTLKNLSRWLPGYLVAEVINHLPQGERNRLYQEVKDLVERISGHNGAPTRERLMTQRVLPFPEARLQGSDLRVISMRKKRRKRDTPRDHIAFELYAQRTSNDLPF